MLSNAMMTVMIQAVASIGRDGSAFAAAFSARRTSTRGRNLDQKPSSKHASAGTIVNQFRKERLPLKIRMICKITITHPEMCRASRGQNINHGAMSSARKLYQTPIFKNARGKK